MTNTELSYAKNIILGTTEAKAMYIGSTLIWKKIPYDTEITYIESSGTLFIDTGILLFDTSNVNFSIEFKANILGRSGGYSTYGNVINAMYEVSPYPGFVYRVSNESVNTLQLAGTGSIDLLGTVDNVAIRTISANTTASTHNTSTTIFAGYDSNNNPWRFVDMRLYYLKILNHGVLVRDFIPVRVGQIGYLYDKISGLLFGNLGTGDFILGPDKVSSEVTELKYLEGTGTQYINTGILNSSNVIVDTIMSASGYDCLNGSEYTSLYRFKWGADGNGKIYYGYLNNHTSGVTFLLDLPCTYYLKQGEQYVKDYQGNTILSSTENLSTYSTTPIMLFKCYSGSNWVNNRGTTRIYSCKIYNNGNIMDLIPVRIGQTGYMYDKVSGLLFANAGTGDFILGPDKGEYTKIEYLESTGTQWIDTLIHPTTGYGFELYGGFTSFQNDEFFGGGNNYSNGLGICTHGAGSYGIIVGTTEVCSITATNNVMHLFKVNTDGTVYVDNEYKGQSTTAMPDGSYTMNIFRHSGTQVPLQEKIYYVKIYNSTGLLFDGVPVRVGLVGYMYDKISKLLFTNAGTGNFTLGPDIT